MTENLEKRCRYLKLNMDIHENSLDVCRNKAWEYRRGEREIVRKGKTKGREGSRLETSLSFDGIFNLTGNEVEE